MSTPTRIYVVKDNTTGQKLLIRAANQAQAVRRASITKFSATVASQDDLVTLIGQGHNVIEAGFGEDDDQEAGNA